MHRISLLLLSLSVYGADAPDAHWPHWRGPTQNGVARTPAPASWSAGDFKWKVEVPGKGHSSPVIWGDRIFLTTAIPSSEQAPAPAAESSGSRRGGGDSSPKPEHRFEVLSIDRKSGKVLWRRTAKTAAPHEGHHQQYGSFASPSPVTDGKRVYVSFGSRGLYAYDFNGKLIWQRDLGPMRMRMGFGEGVAPVLHEDTLIQLCDHEDGAFIVALDKSTGKDLWRKSRDEITGWAEPLVIEHGGRKQVVVSATKKVRSYDFKTGDLIWECAGLGLNTIPIPVYANGVVYVMSGYRDPNLLAIRLGRTGDLTGTDAVVWQNNRGNSYTASPILHQGKLFFITDSGMVSMVNAANGEAFYKQSRLPKTYQFKASPVLAGDRVYLASEQGDVIVLKWGEQLEVLATNTVPDEIFIASPAIAQGELYLRGKNTLYCVRELSR